MHTEVARLMCLYRTIFQVYTHCLPIKINRMFRWLKPPSTPPKTLLLMSPIISSKQMAALLLVGGIKSATRGHKGNCWSTTGCGVDTSSLLPEGRCSHTMFRHTRSLCGLSFAASLLCWFFSMFLSLIFCLTRTKPSCLGALPSRHWTSPKGCQGRLPPPDAPEDADRNNGPSCWVEAYESLILWACPYRNWEIHWWSVFTTIYRPSISKNTRFLSPCADAAKPEGEPRQHVQSLFPPEGIMGELDS